MTWSKLDEIRIKAWCAKVRTGTPIESVPEKYREEVRRRLAAE